MIFRGHHIRQSAILDIVVVCDTEDEGSKVIGIAQLEPDDTYIVNFHDSEGDGFIINTTIRCKWEAVALIISLHGSDRSLLEEHYGD